MHIQEILSKYEPCYKGGSGYNFLVNVDDFNALVKHLEQQQEDIDLLVKKVDEQLGEIKEHCETKGLAGGQVVALTKRVDELTERIDKVTAECGVTWINETLLGKEPKIAKEYIR